MAEVTDGAAAPAEPVEEVKPAPGAEEQKPETGAADETAQPEQETTEQQEQRKQSKFQRRLDRQKTARIQAETERDLLKAEIAKRDAQSNQQPKNDGEPKREQFEDYESYLRAVAKYDAKQETAATLKADREAQSKNKPDAGKEKLAKDWVEREKTFQAATKDYETTVAPFIEEDLGSFAFEARQAILESEVGPNLLHYLATHSDDADRISGLSSVRQVAELGKLEIKVSAAPKKTTTAPAPITPVNGGKTSSKDVEKMSNDEYRAFRKTQGARWAR
jgi:hypothetical protein